MGFSTAWLIVIFINVLTFGYMKNNNNLNELHIITTICVLDKCIYKDITECIDSHDACYEKVYVYSLPNTTYSISIIKKSRHNMTFDDEKNIECFFDDRDIRNTLTTDRHKLKNNNALLLLLLLIFVISI